MGDENQDMLEKDQRRKNFGRKDKLH